MEDILSAEPPSPSLHPTTDHRRTSSKLSSSKKGYSDGGPVMRRTIAGTPTNHTPKPMGAYIASYLPVHNWLQNHQRGSWGQGTGPVWKVLLHRNSSRWQISWSAHETVCTMVATHLLTQFCCGFGFAFAL